MIWTKTDAGRTEMSQRALITDRASRTLLLLIDGAKSEEMLLAHMAGLTHEHFQTLQRLGLIEEAGRTGRDSRPGALLPTSASTYAPTAPMPLTEPMPLDAPMPDDAVLDYAQFTARLTQLISRELGLRGFALTLAVEKAATGAELLAVGQRVLDQIRQRKGDPAASAARAELYR